MPKGLSISGMIVAVVVVLLFGLDLAIGMPFKKTSSTMDVIFLVCACVLGYMSWVTFREQV